jgi:hypothetical protein
MESRERELLERVLLNRHCIPIQIIYDINDLLAQPETKQEPVAWMYDWNTKGDELYGNSYYDRVSSDEMAIKRYACDNIRPLYTTPKLQPLSEDEIKQTTKGMSGFGADMFRLGVRFAEKQEKQNE